VLCCGRVTEPKYFKGLKQCVRNPSVVVKVQAGKSSDPAALMREAKAKLDRDEFDEVWSVADVDEFETERASGGARVEASLKLAISNPYFELWLLLHFADWQRHADGCRELTRALQLHVHNYEKQVEFTKFEAGLDDAIARAKNLSESDDSFPNPSTGVWRLVEAIRGGGVESARPR
jgi:hypothetical protein